MELLTATLIGQLAGPASELTTTLFGPGIASRAERRVIDAQDRASASALARRRHEIAEEQEAAESEVDRRSRLHALDLALHREESMDARYPLGQPGRLRGLLPHGVAPCLLVSPTARIDSVDVMVVPEIVADLVGQIDESGQLLRVVTGAFAHDKGRPREIDGNVVAAEVAQFEFTPRPSIIIHFAGAPSAVTAHARLTHLIRTVSDEPAVEMPIARLDGDALQFAAWRSPEIGGGTHLERLTAQVGGAAGPSRSVALGTAIAVFALAISSVYWRLQGVRWRIERPSLEPLNEMFHAAAELVVSTEGDSNLSERMSQELAELSAIHTEIEVFDGDREETLGVYVPRADRTITFLIGPEYPTAPPEILVREDDGVIREVRLDGSQWGPSRSLTDLLEAFE